MVLERGKRILFAIPICPGTLILSDQTSKNGDGALAFAPSKTFEVTREPSNGPT